MMAEAVVRGHLMMWDWVWEARDVTVCVCSVVRIFWMDNFGGSI